MFARPPFEENISLFMCCFSLLLLNAFESLQYRASPLLVLFTFADFRLLFSAESLKFRDIGSLCCNISFRQITGTCEISESECDIITLFRGIRKLKASRMAPNDFNIALLMLSLLNLSTSQYVHFFILC